LIFYPLKTSEMAKLTVPFPFKGKWAGISVYELKGVGTVGRQGWGPSAKAIATKPEYDITRRNNQEFKACSKASKYFRRTLHPLEWARDHRLSHKVTSRMYDFLPLDGESEFGKRQVFLSSSPRLLEGINLSERYPFDTVVRGGLSYELYRQTLSASIDLPALKAGVSFIPTGKQPYFKVVAALGVAPDLLWQGEGYGFDPSYEGFRPVQVENDWTPTAKGSDAESLQLQLPYTPPDDAFALVLTLGILMGTIGRRGGVEAVKYAGCAKVLAAG
jgi:hypothetical protein